MNESKIISVYQAWRSARETRTKKNRGERNDDDLENSLSDVMFCWLKELARSEGARQDGCFLAVPCGWARASGWAVVVTLTLRR